MSIYQQGRLQLQETRILDFVGNCIEVGRSEIARGNPEMIIELFSMSLYHNTSCSEWYDSFCIVSLVQPRAIVLVNFVQNDFAICLAITSQVRVSIDTYSLKAKRLPIQHTRSSQARQAIPSYHKYESCWLQKP